MHTTRTLPNTETRANLALRDAEADAAALCEAIACAAGTVLEDREVKEQGSVDARLVGLLLDGLYLRAKNLHVRLGNV